VGSVDGSILKIIPESFTEDVWFKIIITGACEPAWANAEESNLFFFDQRNSKHRLGASVLI
jgi:hypothetical protein